MVGASEGRARRRREALAEAQRDAVAAPHYPVRRGREVRAGVHEARAVHVQRDRVLATQLRQLVDPLEREHLQQSD